MGAYLSKPITKKETEEGVGNRLTYGASCMQGWRVSQEDAHNCIPEFDEKSSLFSVYDGHGGAEVAIYLSRHFPEFLKKTEGYQKQDLKAALHEAYVKIDAHIKSPEAMAEIQKIAKKDAGENEDNVADYEEENVGQLYEEATMPIEALMAKYSGSLTGIGVSKEFIKEGADEDKPGSSKEVAQSSCSSSSCVKITTKTPGGSEAEESLSSTSAEPTGVVKSSTEPECSSSSNNSSSSSEPKPCASNDVEDTAEAETTVQRNSPPGPTSSNENSSSVDVEPSSSTNEADCDSESSTIKPHLPAINGLEENVEPDSTEDDAMKGSEPSSVNGTNEVKVNGDAEADSTQSESGVKTSLESPKRKGKVHPPPPAAVIPKPTRSSPRKKLDDAKVYKDFINEESASSESDEDVVVKSLGNSSDSDDDDDENVPEKNSSSSDEDEEMAEEEEDEDDDGDEDDEEDSHVLSDLQEPGYDSGSTAVVAFCKWDGDKLHLYVANAGDSRCVVSRGGAALEMSHDHKPEDEIEARRIINAGGKVTQDGRVNSGLNLSRAIGDHSYKQNLSLPAEEQMITSVPDVQHEILDPSTDQFFVLACDGVWNSMSSQEVVDFITLQFNKGLSEAQVCEELFDACLAHDTSGDGTGCDNMTAIIVKLPHKTSPEDGEVTSVTATNEQNKRRLSSPSQLLADDSKRLKTVSD